MPLMFKKRQKPSASRDRTPNSDEVTVSRKDLNTLIQIAEGAASQAKEPAAIRNAYEPIAEKHDIKIGEYGVAYDWQGRIFGRTL